ARLAEEGSAVDEEEAAAWIEAVVEKLQRAGALNDRAYAEGRVVSLRRQGESARGIAMKLGAKGVPRETVEAALELDEPENDDAAAAVAYARRRRLGPWRKPDEREERHDRDMAALARKGYRLELCRRVIEAQDVFAAEELARGED
ncbi:MAG: RecX family transcriptional regulator, partial [Proteobacteria bacterium]|nr:RecX family transcriptional regulator [Pseudomonadota bacterium]